MSKTDTRERGLESLIMGGIRTTERTPGILFERLAVFCYKSLLESSFLFEWKTSA